MSRSSKQDDASSESIWRERFGMDLRRVRLAMGLTQTELGAMVGLSHGRISQLEHGDPSVPLATIIALAQRLGLDMNRVFGVPPQAPGPSEPWFSELFMLRLPAHVQALWNRADQQAVVVQTLEAMVRSLRATMGPRPEGGRPRAEE